MPGLTLLLSLTALFGIKNPEKNHHDIIPAPYTAAETTITHQLGEKTVTLKVIRYGSSINNCCINLHDDEVTAVKAAKIVLEQKGGVLIKIENKMQRMISFPFKGTTYTFDPNRIFSPIGIKGTLKANKKINPLAVIEVEKFATQLLQLIPDSINCLVALHNNSDGNFSVKTYERGGSRQNDARQVYADNWQDADDIVFTTDEMLFTKMSANGYNSILQDNINVNRDGSLSVFFGEQNRRYVNIETQHGKTMLYKEMLDKLLLILEEEKKPAINTASVQLN